MPSIGPVVETGGWRQQQSRAGSSAAISIREHPYFSSSSWAENHPQHGGVVVEVGRSCFIVKSADRDLIQELRHFSESLREDPRAEARFTVKLLSCTEQGRLRPWGWQRQPGQVG
jgi:hypothetical protein